MTRLRFRTWDKTKQEMLYDNFVIRTGNSPEWSKTLCNFKKPYVWIEGNMGAELLETPTLDQEQQIEDIINPGMPYSCAYELIDWSNFYSLENLITMQSTGLLDKNNKEIFEKDILKYENIEQPIEWDGFCFVWYGMPVTNIEKEYGIVSTKLEIIGNIFEDKNETK